MAAALKGATQIGFTIISLTVSLIAVLIPLLFMGDVVGRLFREFAVTLAITILISAVVSLTLVPMMSARWLKHLPEGGGESRLAKAGARMQRFFDGVIARYDIWLTWVLKRQGATLLVALGPRGNGAVGLVRPHGRAAAGHGQSHPGRSGCRDAEFIYRCGRSQQHHAAYRPHADQPEKIAHHLPAGNHGQAAAPRGYRGRCHALPAAHARLDD
jgi:hypothetical protein